MIFNPDDWVRVNFRKERFPQVRKGKLSPRGDGPFLMIDLPSEYNVHNVFNVTDLVCCRYPLDWRTNHFQEGVITLAARMAVT